MKVLLQTVLPIRQGHFVWCPALQHPQGHTADCFRCKQQGYLIAFVLGMGIAGLEFWGSHITHSLSLLSDAWHVVFDVLGYAIGIIAMHRMHGMREDAARVAVERKRFEGWMAFFLLVAAAVILEKAFQRVFFGAPEIVETARMLVITVIGLFFNVVTYFLFKSLAIQHEHGGEMCTHTHEHVHERRDDILRANMLHTLLDAVSSGLVVVLAVVFMVTSDPRFRYLD
jgi:Co/Zn/Cd efflux system component